MPGRVYTLILAGGLALQAGCSEHQAAGALRPDDPAHMKDLSPLTAERRLTHEDVEHGLTNANIWTRDSAWIGYDVRPENGAAFNAVRVAMVNIYTGEHRVLYSSHDGAGCGVVTFNPARDEAVFILGPDHPAPDWDYAFWRRRGVFVDLNKPGEARAMDAMNYAPPFTAGALRGGSHVHIFSPDGKWLSFTYEDDVLARLDVKTVAGEKVPQHDINQRNIAIAVTGRPVQVQKSHPRNHDGTCFSTVVSRTVNNPRPGSDEISRAVEEGWVGNNGYIKADGTRQRRALAFQGEVRSAAGGHHPEVYIVDIPDDITCAGDAPLEGTETRRPAPPRGTVQRRLTFTDTRKYPGLTAEPRHWLRSSPDGEAIAFIMKDDSGIAQLWTVPPRGGKPRQVTFLRESEGLESAFTWSPDGRFVAAIVDGSVCVIEARTGNVFRLTPRCKGEGAPAKLVCVFSPDGRFIAYKRGYKISEKYERHVYVLAMPRLLK